MAKNTDNKIKPDAARMGSLRIRINAYDKSQIDQEIASINIQVMDALSNNQPLEPVIDALLATWKRRMLDHLQAEGHFNSPQNVCRVVVFGLPPLTPGTYDREAIKSKEENQEEA